MEPIRRGTLIARLDQGAADVAAALELRGRVFRAGRSDRDAADARCRHVLVERLGVLQATFRIRLFPQATEIADGYAGQHYDLRRLAARGGAMAELGRFCTDPGLRDPDLIRMAWAAVTRLVDLWGARFLFGCTSFPGTDPAAEVAGLAHLAAHHLAPADWAPGIAAPEVVRLRDLAPARPSPAGLPPLLRSYLLLGGRVSDHVVIDRDLGTFHIFTGLDLGAVPPARAAALRDLCR